MDVNRSLFDAVREGRLEDAKKLINSYGLSYSPAWSKGYVLLCEALKNRKAAVAKLLLTHTCKVNSKTSCVNPTDTPLHFAVPVGDIEIVKMILDKGANINAKNSGGKTPLHDAIEYNKIKIVEILLNHGANVNDTDNEGPLNNAIEYNKIKIVELLLKHGANVNAKNNGGETPLYNALRYNEGKTPLYKALKYNNIEIVELLLKHGANVNDTDNKGGSPLHVAVGRGHEEMVTLLLSRGAHVDFKGEDGITCLHVAAKKGYVKIAKDLLNHGACIHSLTLKEEYTPLHFASEQGNREAVEVAELLISYKADTNAFDKNGKTPIFYAIKNANLKITKLLLSSGADIKYSPVLLNMAVKKEQIDIVEALLQLGADVNACDIFGRTALHVAAESERKLGRAFQNYREPEINIKGKIATLLLSKGANVNAKQKDGMTALHIAIRMDHKDVIKKLLECGAKVENCMLHLAAKRGCCEIIEAIMKLGGDINSKNIYGRTALHIASQKGHTKVVVTLLNYGADINITCNNNHTPLDYTKMGSFYMHMRNDSLFDYPSHDIWSYTKTSDVLEFYMVKMRTANLYVEGFSQILSNSCKWRPIEDDCKKEIEIMKSEKINNANVSFYDILAKGINSAAMYLRNENILLALKSGDYKTKFPFYASMLTSNFNMGLKRKELLEQGNKVSHLIFNHFPPLPQDCTERIFSYLNDKELRILIKACYPI